MSLRECVDTVITIPNERLLNAVPKGTRFHESFRLVDDVLLQAVQGISDIITVPGLINVDFADVKAIMEGMGMALMGTGSAAGENRALEATQRAISSPLLEEASIEGAKGLLVNVSGGADLTLFEVNEAMSIIHDAADPDANIIFGAVLDERLTNEMKITVIATGFDKAAAAAEPNRPYAAPDPAAAGSQGEHRAARLAKPRRAGTDAPRRYQCSRIHAQESRLNSGIDYPPLLTGRCGKFAAALLLERAALRLQGKVELVEF